MLQRLHRASALVIGLYAVAHLANHLAAVDSVASHIAFMDKVRLVTRVPALEALLLACVLFQAVSGLALVARRRGQRRARFDRLQAISGLYLAFFLLVHVSSVLAGRILQGVDTNFHFAAAGLHVAPFQFFFFPYYGLAVLAFGVHLAAAFHYLARGRVGSLARTRIAGAGIAAALLLSGLILAAFGGMLHPVAIPEPYRANLEALLR
ncbi:hypothetical protein ACSUZJ_08775 [Telluria sp. B2]